VVGVHHTGREADSPTRHSGRGASARLAAADVGIVFRVRGTAEERDDSYAGQTLPRSDLCRLQISKDRAGMFGRSSLYLRMVGNDCFERVTFEEWRRGSPPAARVTKTEAAEKQIGTFLRDGREHPRTEIEEAMRSGGIGIHATRDALRRMAEAGVLTEQKGAAGRLYYRVAGAPASEESRLPVLHPL
jgi:hypothetical protein